MTTAYFDCFSGISGDMTVGALIDAGADFDAIRTALHSLGVKGFEVSAEKVKKKGIMATQFHVHIDEGEKQPHRHLRHVVEIIEQGELSTPVKEAAIETFRLLAEAEAEVHGSTIEKVHFHEVGAVDSIVDIVAAQLACHLLGITSVAASPLHVGSGTVKCAHGVMPVPAPATALLLKGKPTYGEVAGELVTPTGAAFITQRASTFGPMPPMQVKAIGYGCGTKDLPDRPNVLRVLLGEAADDQPLETVTVIEATMDDMSGELYPPLLQALLDAGARDAFITPIIAKKGRPAHCITVLCDAEKVQLVTEAMLANSTTIGLRMRDERRVVLPRSWRTVATEWGKVRVKVTEHSGADHTRAPEFEDCRKAAGAAGVPVRRVYDAACAAAVRGEWDDE